MILIDSSVLDTKAMGWQAAPSQYHTKLKTFTEAIQGQNHTL